ncbi:MAG: shikimate kinase [Candidatus Flexifilum sp.]
MVIPISGDTLPNIVLTGFMGVGKTTIGMLTAQRLARPFVDTDAVIVQRQRRSVREIFARDGEAAFRALERELAAELAEHRGLVIATGGGMLVDPSNRDLLARSGILICLDASAKTIAQRLQDAVDRPLASHWQALLEARREAYAAIAYHVHTDEKSPEQIVDEVIALWQTALK